MEKNNTLPLICKREQIVKNAATLESYLKKGNSQESEYAKGLIQRGKCFVVVSSPDGYSFYPSRFMWYVDNTMEKHEKMGEAKRTTGEITRDGRKANPAISKCLGDLIKEGNKHWNSFETEYKNFCKRLGITPDNNKRSFWQPISG